MNPLEALIRKLWDRSGARSRAQDARLQHTERLVARARRASAAAYRARRMTLSYTQADGRLRR